MAIPPNQFEQFDRIDLIALFRSYGRGLQALEARIAVAESSLEILKGSIATHFSWLGFHVFLSIFAILFIPITEGKSLFIALGDSLLIWKELNKILTDSFESTRIKRSLNPLRTEARELYDLLIAIEREFDARDIPRIAGDQTINPINQRPRQPDGTPPAGGE